MEDLGTVDDQVAQSPSGGEKFPDDNTYQGQPDIDFGGTEQGGNGSRQYHFEKDIPAVSTQCADQNLLFRIYLMKGGVKADDGSEYCHRDSKAMMMVLIPVPTRQ